MKKLLLLLVCLSITLSSCTDYKSQIEELQTANSVLNTTISQLQSNISDLESDLSIANGTIVQKDKEISELNTKLSEYTKNKTNNQKNTATTKNKSVTVYITKTGSKYHKYGCGYLKQSCYSINLNDARSRGYTPCSRCY